MNRSVKGFEGHTLSSMGSKLLRLVLGAKQIMFPPLESANAQGQRGQSSTNSDNPASCEILGARPAFDLATTAAFG